VPNVRRYRYIVTENDVGFSIGDVVSIVPAPAAVRLFVAASTAAIRGG